MEMCVHTYCASIKTEISYHDLKNSFNQNMSTLYLPSSWITFSLKFYNRDSSRVYNCFMGGKNFPLDRMLKNEN